MIVRRSSATGELCLEGTSEDLRAFSSLLQKAPGSIALSVPSKMSGYDDHLLGISIRERTGSHVSLKYDSTSSSLVVEGDPRYLAVLAANITALANNSVQGHLHIEFFPGHFYLDEASDPVVVKKVSS